MDHSSEGKEVIVHHHFWNKKNISKDLINLPTTSSTHMEHHKSLSAVHNIHHGNAHLQLPTGHKIDHHIFGKKDNDFVKHAIERMGILPPISTYILLAHLVYDRKKPGLLNSEINTFMKRANAVDAETKGIVAKDIEHSIFPSDEHEGGRSVLDYITYLLVHNPKEGSDSYRHSIADIWLGMTGGEAIKVPKNTGSNIHVKALRKLWKSGDTSEEIHVPAHAQQKKTKHLSSLWKDSPLTTQRVKPNITETSVCRQILSWNYSVEAEKILERVIAQIMGMSTSILKGRNPEEERLLRKLLSCLDLLTKNQETQLDALFYAKASIAGTIIDTLVALERSGAAKIVDDLLRDTGLYLYE